MNCREAQDWLLRSEQPEEPDVGPPAVVKHLRVCPDCRKVVGRVNRIEQAHRDTPLPPNVNRLRNAFLRRVTDPPIQAPWQRWPWKRLVRVAVAALLLLALGMGTWALLTPKRASAADLIERLVDWELELSEAPSQAERQRIFNERSSAFQAELRRARLAEEDRALAQYLYDTSAKLAKQEGPLEDAEDFDQVAQRFLERLKASTEQEKPQEEKTRAAFARCYHRVLERGVEANVDRARVNKRLPAEQKRRLDLLQKRGFDRGERMENMFKALPVIARHPEVRWALDKHRKRRQLEQALKLKAEGERKAKAEGERQDRPKGERKGKAKGKGRGKGIRWPRWRW